MKRLCLIFTLILLCIPTTVFCQELTPDNAVALDPIWLLVNTYKGSYERRITDQFSAQLEVAYSPDFAFGLHKYETLTYLDVIVEGRYYFGSLLKDQASEVEFGSAGKYLSKIFTDALGGLYIGLYGGYVNSIVEDGEGVNYYKGIFNGAGGGAELGLKYIFGNGKVSFFCEPYVTFQFYKGGYTYKDENGDSREIPIGFDDGFDRNGVAGGLNIGLVF